MYWDVFISYRRDGGSAHAHFIKERLQRRFKEFNIFLDTESIKSGEFGKYINNAIENCSNYLVLLTPGSLRRCFEEGKTDFFLEEMRCANQIWRAYSQDADARQFFRIIPVFLGENLNHYSTFQNEGHAEVHRIIQEIAGDVGHNGINLCDTASFDSEMKKLLDEDTLLLSRSKRLSVKLVNTALSQSRTDPKRDLLDLFNALIKTWPESEISKARDKLAEISMQRLTSAVNRNNIKKRAHDTEKSEAAVLSDILSGFSTDVLKATLEKSVGETQSNALNPPANYGSRTLAINRIKDWLDGNPLESCVIPHSKGGAAARTQATDAEATDNEASEATKPVDRLAFVLNALARCLPSKKTLLDPIKEKYRDKEFDVGGFHFGRAAFRRFDMLCNELMEHFSYKEMIRFFLDECPESRLILTSAHKSILDEIDANFKDIEIMKVMPRRNARLESMADIIEAFVSYDKDFFKG